jgi:hypothetical protein
MAQERRACAGCARSVVTASSSPARRHGGALTSSKVLPVSSRGHREGDGEGVGGGAHPSGGAVWRRLRMLQAAAFVGGEGGRW